ncbi:MAG: hypothetical protein M1835_003020 [Candelina submexicana]|nr:MAG: hypothetical protein M1835_003020 [Candelina submexicana]
MALTGPPSSRPTVLTGILPTELIEYILDHHAAPSTLIICSSRETFLHQLLTLTQKPHSSSPPPAGDNTSETSPQSERVHRFLIPTLHLLSTSCTIGLAFCPTLQHLRAYLTIYQASAPSPSPPLDKPGTRVSILALLNAIALHRSTPDLSAQGLSRTFAAAVEAAVREKMALVVSECGKIGDDGGDLESEPWEEQVPLLNGVLRGLGAEGRVGAGRTVKIRRVLERWCVFRTYKVDGDDNDDDCNDEELADVEAVTKEDQNEEMLEI